MGSQTKTSRDGSPVTPSIKKGLSGKSMSRNRLRLSRKEADKERAWLMERQNGKCAICGRKTKRPFLDHDHLTGAVRGVLCSYCNTGLGQFFDSPEVLVAAIECLMRHWHGEDVVVLCEWSTMEALHMNPPQKRWVR